MPLTSDVMGRGFGKVFSVHTTKVLQVFNDKGDEGGFDLGFGLGIEHEFAYQLREQSLPLQEISLTSLLGDGGVALSSPYHGP
jgi:hypothetical protein